MVSIFAEPPREPMLSCPNCHSPLDSTVADSTKVCPSCQTSLDGVLDTTDPEPRHSVAHFELLKKVGSGRFGTVWKARDTRLDRVVALKLPREKELSAERVASVFREARSAAQLRHPNIVTVHEVGRDGDTTFIVGDFVDGVNLSEWLRSNAPDVRQSAGLCVAIARALHHAHSAQVVHRDLKPANILMDADDEPHIADFGIARRASDVTLTEQGHPLGTPAYMSPEQARGDGHHADGRSDIFSLGVILYEMMTGELPFAGPVNVLLYLIEHKDPVPPRQYGSRVPRDLENICLKCLEKDPRERYSTADELANDLQRWLDGQPVRVRPVSPVGRCWRFAKRHPLTSGLALVVCLLLIGMAIVGPLRARRESQLKQKEVQARKNAEKAKHQADLLLAEQSATLGIARLEQNDLLGAMPWLSRACQAEWPAEQQKIHRTRLDFALRRASPLRAMWFHTEAVTHVAFSPDGKYVVSASRDKTAKLVDVETGQIVGQPLKHDDWVLSTGFDASSQLLLTSTRDGRQRAWLVPSGESVGADIVDGEPVVGGAVLAGGTRVTAAWLRKAQHSAETVGADILLPRPGGGFRRIPATPIVYNSNSRVRLWKRKSKTTPHEVVQTFDLRHRVSRFDISLDQKMIILVEQFGKSLATAQVYDVQTGKKRAPFFKTAIYDAVFTPDEKHILAGGRGKEVPGSARIFDVKSGTAKGVPMRHPDVVTRVLCTPDGKHAVTLCRDGGLRVWALETAQIVSTMMHKSSPVDFAMDRNGSRVVTVSKAGTVNSWSLPSGRRLGEPLHYGTAISTMAIHPHKPLLAMADSRGVVRLVDFTASATRQRPLPLGFTDTSRLQFVSQNQVMLLRGKLQSAYVPPDTTVLIDRKTGRPLRVANFDRRRYLRGGGGVAVHAMTGKKMAHLNGDGKHKVRHASVTGRFACLLEVVAKDKPQRLRLVQLGQKQVERGTWLVSEETGAASASSDGTLVITYGRHLPGRTTTAQIWSAADGSPKGKPLQHSSVVIEGRFSADNRLLCTVSSDNRADRVHFWKVGEGVELFPPLEFDATVTSVRFSPDSRLLAVTTSTGQHNLQPGGETHVFDTATGKLAYAPLKHIGEITFAAFDHSGKYLATAGSAGVVRVWDARTGVAVTPKLNHGDSVNHLAFSPNSLRLVTASDDRLVRFWSLPKGRLLQPALRHSERVSRLAFHASGDQGVSAFAVEVSCSR